MLRRELPIFPDMFERFFPTLAGGKLRNELKTTALAFLILTVIGFAAAYLFPESAVKLISFFTDKVESLGLDQLSGAEVFTTIFLNNLFASFSAMIDGVIPFVYLSAAALGTNALLIGAFGAIYQKTGLGLLVYLIGILPHGIFELPAIIASCALGLSLCKIGTARLLHREAHCRFLIHFRDCSRFFFLFVLPLLFLAALIETYLTPVLLALTL